MLEGPTTEEKKWRTKTNKDKRIKGYRICSGETQFPRSLRDCRLPEDNNPKTMSHGVGLLEWEGAQTLIYKILSSTEDKMIKLAGKGIHDLRYLLSVSKITRRDFFYFSCPKFAWKSLLPQAQMQNRMQMTHTVTVLPE